MGAKSNIEWTDASWTPIRAKNLKTGKLGWHCEHDTTGCIHCYSEAMNLRLGTGLPFKPGHRKDIEIFLDEKMLEAPLHWKKPRMVFVCSMTDLFAEFMKDEWIDRVVAIMALCPQHTFQLLTKRAGRMRDYWSALTVERIKKTIEDYGNSLGPDTEDFEFFANIGWESHFAPCKPDCQPPCALVWTPDGSHTIRAKDTGGAAKPGGACHGTIRWDGPVALPLPNVWLGVSCERQQEADERIPLLLHTPAAIRFISAEPLLGPIDLTELPSIIEGEERPLMRWNALTGQHRCGPSVVEDNKLDWVIVGGESGKDPRPMHPQWARDIQKQCEAAGVEFFFKQWGGWVPDCGPAKDGTDPIFKGRGPCAAWTGDRWHMAENGFIMPLGIGPDHDWMYRVGKKAAGRFLDGVQYNGFPQAPMAVKPKQNNRQPR